MAPPKTYQDLDKLYEEASEAFETGHFRRARTLYLEVLRDCDDLIDQDYRVTIRELIGICCYKLDDFKAAARHNRRTLKLLAHGNNPKLVTLRHNLARDLSAIHNGDPSSGLESLEKAIALHRENLEILLGSEKREDELLETKYSLAFDLAELSKCAEYAKDVQLLLEEAGKLSRQVLQRREQESSNGPLTIQSRHNLAGVLFRQGKYPEAKILLLQNQKHINSLSSTGRKKNSELLQSTEGHLAACCEATKDISLSILQITDKPIKNCKRGKARTDDTSSASSPATPATPDIREQEESGGQLWTLPTDVVNNRGQ